MNRLQLQKKIQDWVGNLTKHQCLLCHQIADTALCEVCLNDICRYDTQKYHGNLLMDNNIAEGLIVNNFDALFAIGPYQRPLSQFLTALKFARKSIYIEAMGLLFDRYYQPDHDKPQALLPIPLHNKRLATRRFNQAGMLAKRIAASQGIAYEPHALTRVKATSPQTQLTAKQRQTNLCQAFEIGQPIHFQHVALFDDVITTGATMDAAVTLLKSTYPMMKIDVWAVCITHGHR